MAVKDQVITDNYAMFNGDCVETMREMPSESVHLTVYSPPFAGLYQYSSDPRDMSNAIDRDEFFEHYGYCIDEVARLTLPGRISAAHHDHLPGRRRPCGQVDFQPCGLRLTVSRRSI